MNELWSAAFRFSTVLVEPTLQLIAAALGTLQSVAGAISGQTFVRPAIRPPSDIPPDIDTATAELSGRLVHLAVSTGLRPAALADASGEAISSARQCFSYVDTDPRAWWMLPVELPLSLGTLFAQQGLRAWYVTHIVGPDRVAEFIDYMFDPINDQRMFVSLQYGKELDRQQQQVQRNPGDVTARINLGRTYLKCGLYLEAARELEIAAKCPDPSLRARALYEGTVASYRAGNFAAAVRTGTAALAIDSASERARFWLWQAAQKLGGYPADVAHEFRMSMQVGFEPPTVEFEDVAAQIGLDKTCGGRGTAVFDFDGDGYLDVVIGAAHGGTGLFRNKGDGTFTEVTVGSGLEDCVNSFAVSTGDYNNDGRPDLFVTRLGFYPGECVLYRNNGDGTFTDVTTEAGVGCWGPGFAATWADYDCDGYLDLFVANNLGGLFDRKTPNRLFHNNGDGTFTEVAEQAGLRTDQPSICGAWGDYDNDGYPDLFVSNGVGRSQLFRNNGDGTFTDVSRAAGIDSPCFGSTAFWVDYDNDGWLDLVQCVWSPPDDVIHTMRTGHAPAHGKPLRVFHNNRDGTFTLRSRELGITGCWGTMSGNAGDFNNDGYLDLLLGNGSPHMDRNEPPVLLEADAHGTFHNVTFAAGLPFTGKGHGANLADLAGDGRLSLIVASGGAYPGDLLTTSVYRPVRLPGNYLNVRLVGTTSNRDAVGARLVLRAGGRDQHRLVSGGSGFGCLPYEQHFGLGTVSRIDCIEVRWPNGLRQVVANPPVNRTVRLVEGQEGWEAVYMRRDRHPELEVANGHGGIRADAGA